MTTGKKASAKQSKKRPATAARRIKRLTKELSREDIRLGMPLLDAALAGVILGFRPSDREMREQAAHCWQALKPMLVRHLISEDEAVLPWAEGMAGFSTQVMKRIKRRHDELRLLARKLTGVSFEEDRDEIVAPAGKALCMLAVKLDDLIDSEELRLLPALRKLLFAQPGGKAAS